MEGWLTLPLSIFDESCHPGQFSLVNISLTPELEKAVKEKVASGLYHNANEVIREALRPQTDQGCHRGPSVDPRIYARKMG